MQGMILRCLFFGVASSFDPEHCDTNRDMLHVWQPGSPLTHWTEREMLATAYRALASRAFNAGSGLGSHLTMSVGPEFTDFLVVRFGVHWFEVTAENLVLVDNSGNILEGEGPVQGAAVSLHGPIHKKLKRAGRVIFHTHQPWFTALACIKFGGLRMFHPEASIYDGRIGFDPVYTGNWPQGSKLGAMKEGERLMQNPHLKGKDIGFLGNHGTFQISTSVEEALFDCFNLERLAKLQVAAMMHARPFRELSPSKVAMLKERYEKQRKQAASAHYRQYIRRDLSVEPLPSAWNGLGPIPLSSDIVAPAPAPFAQYTMDAHEWSLRSDMAATCRLVSRLNGHQVSE